jgi:hypothetical protein
MKIKLTSTNENYAAVVVHPASSGGFETVENLDNLRAYRAIGHTALCSKTLDPDKLYIMFTSETQISEFLCHKANLFAKAEMNFDNEVKGYIGKNRRVKAVKFQGNTSNAMLLPVEELEHLLESKYWEQLKVGDKFTDIAVVEDGTTMDVEVCRKYVSPVKEGRGSNQQVANRYYNEKLFPKHGDTSNIFRSMDIKVGDEVVITQKLHGTSARIANQLVDLPIDWKAKVAEFFGVKIARKEYALMAGSRNGLREVRSTMVQKDKKYGGEATLNIWSRCLEEYKDQVPKGYCIYGEIVGYDGLKAVQKDYSYSIEQGKFKFYVYRVSVINEDGVEQELDWDNLRAFCAQNGFTSVPFLTKMVIEEDSAAVIQETFLDKRLADLGLYPEALPLDKKKIVDEGVVVRSDTPFKAQKARSPLFLVHESKVADAEEVEVENAS